MNGIEKLQAWQATQSRNETRNQDGLLSTVDQGDATCQYGWQAGELRQIREANGQRWRYDYGDDGRLLRVHHNERLHAEYRYDAKGWLSEIVCAEVRFQHQHDSDGRLLRSLRGNASPYSFQWQGDRVTRARCAHESTDFKYDAQGRLIGLKQKVDDIGLSLKFHFDTQGRLAQVQFVEWHEHINFTWDERGRPATMAWNEKTVACFGHDDAQRRAWSELANARREETFHEHDSGLARKKSLRHADDEIWSCDIERDDAFRLSREGARRYRYDAQGRLCEAQDDEHHWRYQYDLMDQPLLDHELKVRRDTQGRVDYLRNGTQERVFRHNDGDEMLEALQNGKRLARCVYDHKGRLLIKQTRNAYERYLYGADDALLAVADEKGRAQIIFLRQPTGLVALIDFRRQTRGELIFLHHDLHGNLVYTSDENGCMEGPFDSDPYGRPLRLPTRAPYFYRGRAWHEELGLYRFGCRWYDPLLQQFLSADSYTGAPDDARLVNPFLNAREQRMARAQILSDWLREPRFRNRYVYCCDDPVNRFDANGHWSFGGVLLSLLGVIWTLPNTIFGLAVEITCLLGEVIRWLVWLVSGGNASWQTPGFDVAASGRLNAFALVFKGGWLGSFENLLGITFGNVFFVNGEYENHPAFQALPDPVSPPAYDGEVTIPKSQALYEHELRHVNQYGWWGPFFHLGLPLWGAYLWDVILNGYQNASMERDARDHGGF